MRDQGGEDRADADVEHHHAEPGPELCEEEHGQHDRLRAARWMKRAKNAKLKKLIVAVAQSDARTTGERRMKRAPATTRPRSSVEDGGSTGSIRRRKMTEIK